MTICFIKVVYHGHVVYFHDTTYFKSVIHNIILIDQNHHLNHYSDLFQQRLRAEISFSLFVLIFKLSCSKCNAIDEHHLMVRDENISDSPSSFSLGSGLLLVTLLVVFSLESKVEDSNDFVTAP